MNDAYMFSISMPVQFRVLHRPYQPHIRRRGRANLRAMRRDWQRRFKVLNP